MRRPQLTETDINLARRRLDKELARRLNEKGHGSFITTHEIQGVLNIELYEVTKAIHSEPLKRVADELYDAAVACLVGAAGIEAGKTY